MRQPQHDIPTEVIIHYIVKDYRRMFLTYDELQTRAEKAEAKVRELQEKNEQHNAHIESLRKGFNKNLAEVRASRDAAIEAVTEDLREQLESAKRRVKILLQAIDDPDALNRLNEHIISSDDDKIWMNKAMKQLEKALLNFTTIQARLVDTQENMGKALNQRLIGGDADKVYKRFAKVFPKIDSCVSHIEDFFKKIGNIKIEDNGQDSKEGYSETLSQDGREV